MTSALHYTVDESVVLVMAALDGVVFAELAAVDAGPREAVLLQWRLTRPAWSQRVRWFIERIEAARLGGTPSLDAESVRRLLERLATQVVPGHS